MKKISVFLLILLVLGGLLSFSYVQISLRSTSNNTKNVILRIPAKAGIHKIGKILEENDVISSHTFFEYWCRYQKCNLKAGWFEIPPRRTLKEVISIIENGKGPVKKVTIPEGRASWEIPAYFRKAYPNFNGVLWEKWIYNSEFIRELGVSASSLEGYLLPDTYLFPYEVTEKEAIRTMVKANLRLRDAFYKKGSPFFEILGGWHEVLTLASVVEEETGNPKERPLISGVFHNRLRIGMPLGADPTVRFIFKNLTGPIYKSQLNSNNPYNTRKFKGLMPGPISNPGRHAIEAVLYPEDTDMLYFVAKDNGSGEHFFSSTLKEHNHYKEVAARNRKK
ncbi:MAG: endolytic transglycosylase MltG [Fibrobacter sp.]|jgi:UPF0755 protein|nr:endolytic transglycosylase MltG [Fibrobacter sp.]